MLMGVVDLRELVLAPDDMTLGDLMGLAGGRGRSGRLERRLAELFASIITA